MSRRRRPLLGLALLAAPLAAAEPAPAPAVEPAPLPAPAPAAEDPAPDRWAKPWTLDLRMLLGGAASIDEVEVDGSTSDVDSAASGALRIHVLYGYRPAGGVLGFQLGGGPAFVSHIGEDGDTDLVYGTASLELTGGLLWMPTPGLQLEFRPLLRIGSGELDADELDLDDDDVEPGGYAAVGLTAGAWWAWRSGFQLGGELGVEAFAGETEVLDETVEVSGSGGFGAIGLGWRW